MAWFFSSAGGLIFFKHWPTFFLTFATYMLDGTKILRETWNTTDSDGIESTNVLIPLYDNEDSVCGILYNGTPYYFLKNLQGDVIAITDQEGTTVARYSYDAWGVCTIAEDTSDSNIAAINPFRYRGYYYDAEIGMYYLQSRYYDPNMGRFINVDSTAFLGVDGSSLGYNLFAYCSNNSIQRSDFMGQNHLGYANAVTASVAQLFKAHWTIANRNYAYNQVHEVTNYVYGQNYVDMKFASSTVAEIGCGIVAAHNALKALGKGKKLSDIVYYFDKRNALTGDIWAAPYWDVAGCIKKYGGAKPKTKVLPRRFDKAIQTSKNKMGIVAYNWHYFFTKWNSRRAIFTTFNRYSNHTGTKTYISIDKELQGKTPLCLITF